MRSLSLLAFAVSLGTAAAAQTYGPFTYDPAHAFGQAYDASGPILWSDFDADGDLDVAVGNAFGPEELFVNEGSGVYTRRLLPEQAERIDAMGGMWGDFDGDQRLDLMMCGLHAGVFVYWQGEQGEFEQAQVYDPNGVTDCTAADADDDGMLDLLVVHRSREGRPTRLFRNTGNRAFTLRQDVAMIDGVHSSWADVDGDGDLDLFLAANYGEPDRLLLNENGVFEDSQPEAWPRLATASQGGSWGDYDGDGDLDLFTADYSGDNLLYRNDGGRFDVVETETSGETFGSAWGDVDNDGRLDRVSMDFGGAGRLVLQREGEAEVVPLGNGQEGRTEAATLVDHDGDGDLDLFVSYGRVNEARINRVFLNQGQGGNWLKVAVEGTRALGATVRVYDLESNEPRAQTRAVLPRSGRKAQTGATLHFGLGETAVVDSVEVQWPSGACLIMSAVPANQAIRVTEPIPTECARPMDTESAGAPSSSSLQLGAPVPNPAYGPVDFRWKASAGFTYVLEVFDLLGRSVYRVSGIATGAEESVSWDPGRLVGPGSYVIRLQDEEGASETRRFTLVR